jgi:predicted 3-demethylubiquinone-9 3-methyltransferase (glyoxalase superfamily)
MHAHTQLMFQDGRADEAADHYVDVIPDAERTADGFVVAGHRVVTFDSPVQHAFGFTPSTSIFLTVDAADDVDAPFLALADGGEVLMPLDDYGFADRFGWCRDRYGVSWQVSSPVRAR